MSSNVVIRPFMIAKDKNILFGRSIFINNAHNILEVLQANNDLQGCSKGIRSKPSHTGFEAQNCELVINAGLFNTETGHCYGNVINDGKVFVNSNGIRNAHFGIRKDGNLMFGYFSEEEVTNGKLKSLVGGAIWLLRDGKSFVSESVKKECGEVQETGSLFQFASVLSARSAIGAMANGTVVIVQISGRTNNGGINLFDLATLMANMDIVTAINLDGGGSSTLVINGTLVSLPSDKCEGNIFTCERKVTTVLCARVKCPIPCPPRHVCIRGFCELASLSSPQSRIFLVVALLICLFIIITYGFISLVKIIQRRHSARFSGINKNLIDPTPLLSEDFDL